MKRTLKAANLSHFRRRQIQRNITRKREQHAPYERERERERMLRNYARFSWLGAMPFVAAYMTRGVFW